MVQWNGRWKEGGEGGAKKLEWAFAKHRGTERGQGQWRRRTGNGRQKKLGEDEWEPGDDDVWEKEEDDWKWKGRMK
jgi:hypothetical protein